MATNVPDPTDSCCKQLGPPGPGGAARARRNRRALATVGAAIAAGALGLATPRAGFALPAQAPGDQGTPADGQLLDQRAAQAARLDVASATSEQLIAALTTLDQEIQAQVARGAEAERAFQDADRRHNEIKGQLDQNQGEVDSIRDELRRQAIRLYVKPEEDDSSVRLLKAGSFDEAQQKKVLGEAVAGNSRDLIERLRGTRGRLTVLEQEANDALTEAEARRAERAELFARVMAEREIRTKLQAEWDRRMRSLVAGSDRVDGELSGSVSTASSTGRSAPAPQSSNGRLIMPVSGTMADGYGGARNHPGVDILAPVGTPVWAALGGKVSQAVSGGGYNGGYGNLVVIDHPNGLQTRYAHLSTVRVSAGQTVTQGQVVGNVGMTGNTTGPHLHFETYMNGVRQNPANYLP